MDHDPVAPVSAPSEDQLRQEWRTPPNFLNALAQEFAVDIDVAASPDNAVAPRYITRAQDGLGEPWFPGGVRVAWCNPGFRSLGLWVDKAIREVTARPGCVALVMGTAAPSTAWWARALGAGAEIRLLAPRVQFRPPPGIRPSSNAHENALLVLRSPLGGNEAARAHIWTWRWDALATPIAASEE